MSLCSVIVCSLSGPISVDRGAFFVSWWPYTRFARAAQTPLLRRRQLAPNQELRQAQQRVTADGEGGQEGHLFLAHDLHPAHRSAVLAPAEALLDPLAQPLTGQVSGMPRGSSVDRRATLLADVHRHMRGHAALAALGNEVRRVVPLVGSHRALLLRGV